MEQHETDPPAGRTLGEIIRRQREFAELPMRQLAAMAGISNPYLSQIERNLRAPSEQVLHAIANSLQMSSAMLRDAGRGPRQEASRPPVLQAIQDDPDLTAAQRRALEECYLAFRQVTVEQRGVRGRRSP